MQKKTILLIVSVLFIILMFGCSNTGNLKEIQVIDITQNSSEENQEQNVSNNTQRVHANKGKIFNYMESKWVSFEGRYSDTDYAEAMLYIDTSNHFKMPIIEVYRAYGLETNSLKLTENEIDVLGIKRLKDIGFSKSKGKWFFEGKEVNVGATLPVPEDMKPQKPEESKAVNVAFDVKSYLTNSSFLINVKTNLPSDTELFVKLENSNGERHTDEKVIVNNGGFSITNSVLKSGEYKLEFMSPLIFVQNSNLVKTVLGDRGRNMTGKYVSFDPVDGNTIKYEAKIIIP